MKIYQNKVDYILNYNKVEEDYIQCFITSYYDGSKMSLVDTNSSGDLLNLTMPTGSFRSILEFKQDKSKNIKDDESYPMYLEIRENGNFHGFVFSSENFKKYIDIFTSSKAIKFVVKRNVFTKHAGVFR